jgi:cytochrome c biogenesis protein CcmG, thiol:disulfide interchange protein DsbE
MRRRLTLALALMAGLAVIVVVAGCGSSSGGGTVPAPNYKEALKGAPAPLAKLYGEANELLPGGKDAFEKRVGELGYPVVANVWASWCGPCRFEFPLFQEASAKWGKKVAFIGVDAEDSEEEAAKWLKAHPVPYPSYFETGYDYPASLKLDGRPDTVFYNAKGEVVEKHIGQYANAEALEEDIKKYALQGS